MLLNYTEAWYRLKVITRVNGTGLMQARSLQLSFKGYCRPVKPLIARSVTGLYTKIRLLQAFNLVKSASHSPVTGQYQGAVTYILHSSVHTNANLLASTYKFSTITSSTVLVGSSPDDKITLLFSDHIMSIVYKTTPVTI